jgi:hypothetical protein
VAAPLAPTGAKFPALRNAIAPAVFNIAAFDSAREAKVATPSTVEDFLRQSPETLRRRARELLDRLPYAPGPFTRRQMAQLASYLVQRAAALEAEAMGAIAGASAEAVRGPRLRSILPGSEGT